MADSAPGPGSSSSARWQASGSGCSDSSWESRDSRTTMTTQRTILRDSALALPFLAGLDAWLEGPWGAVGVLASGLVTLVNLGLLALLVDRLARATAAGG